MKIGINVGTSSRAALCGIILVGVLHAQATTAANPKNPDPELINQLSNELKVTPTQAKGGAGAIFGLGRLTFQQATSTN